MSVENPIVALECEVRAFPIVVPFTIALETLPSASIVIIRCIDADGRTGWGEAAPFPTLTYDTPETALAAIEGCRHDFIGLLPSNALTLLRRQSDGLRSLSVTAHCGLESAFIDLSAKQQGISLSSWHGAAAVKSVETDITLPIMPATGVSDFFAMFNSYDFNTIKIKVSGHVSDDLDRVFAVLKQRPIGPKFQKFQITLDGNQGFDVSRAKELMTALSKHQVKPLFFEQPLPEKDWSGVEQLARSLAIPLCLDEGVRHAADVEFIATNLNHCKKNLMINLKIMKSGIEGTTAIIAAAKKLGLPMMIGGMLESDIAMSHSLHLASGKGGIGYFDLDTPFFFRQGPARNSPWGRKSSLLECPTGPGLGIDLVSISE